MNPGLTIATAQAIWSESGAYDYEIVQIGYR